MNTIYKDKKTTLEILQNEIRACKKYSQVTIKNAKKRSKAISFLDMAQIHKDCADEAIKALWQFAPCSLTDEELKTLSTANLLKEDIEEAYRAIKH